MSPISFLLGALDDAYFRLKLQRGSPPLFERGWGDGDAIDAVIRRFQARGAALPVSPVWEGEWREAAFCRVRDGGFDAPLYREYLPPETAHTRFRCYLPRAGMERMVVMVPTRFEQAYASREPLAARLARHGVGSLLLESPFMSTRRPRYQPTAMLTTLSDFVLMGGLAIEEARCALAWLQGAGHPAICVTGVSLGGYLAAVAGALAAPPVSIVTLLAPHDGNVVYLEGLSRRLCDWHRLQETCGSAGDVTERFRAVFDAMSLDLVPPPAHGTTVIAIAASHDRYVPPQSFRHMAKLWPEAELRWVPGGHVSTIARRRVYLAALLDGLQRTPRPIRSAHDGYSAEGLRIAKLSRCW